MTESAPRRVGKLEVGIVTTDLDAITRFYQDTLGLEHIGDLDMPGGLMRRWAQGDAVLKAVQWERPQELANPPRGFRGGATGLRWLTIQIDDVAQGAERCRAAGYAVPVPTFEHRPGALLAIVEDPERNWVELIQPERE